MPRNKRRQPDRKESSVEHDPVVADASLSDKLVIWTGDRDIYMRYVTMCFTGLALVFTVLSFCFKTIIVDRTPLVTKIIVNFFAIAVTVLVLGLIYAIHRRAYEFADRTTILENLLRAEKGLALFFTSVPGRPVIKNLVRFSLISMCIALATFIVTIMLLFRDESIFPLPNIGVPQ